ARGDRDVAGALRAPEPGVRLAGALTAGKLLGADPGRFPRTAATLFDVLDDDDERVWVYLRVALVNFAGEHPAQIPDRARTVELLAGVSDRELGLREGATKDALARVAALDYGLGK
ncbi:MAG: adaptin, partial [Salinigranum sp.]